MELHNHLARPEQHNVLHTADDTQSFVDHTGALILHTTQIVVEAGRSTHMPALPSLVAGVRS